MKRLVVTGVPCPPETWEAFLGKRRGQRILSAFDILENSGSSDPRAMAEYVARTIDTYQPDSIVAHDLGVPLTLMGMLKLSKRGKAPQVKITLFNGAFRKANIFKATTPLRMQYLPTKRAVREVQSKGGQVDMRLRKHIPRIRALYRRMILAGLVERTSSALGLDDFLGVPERLPLRASVQMIVSKNDPFIPFEAIQQLRRDCFAQRLVEVDYGHFPYTAPREKIVPLIEEFEKP